MSGQANSPEEAPWKVVIDQFNQRFDLLQTDVREVRGHTRDIPAIKEHLRTLNGRTAKNEVAAEQLKAALEAIAARVDGRELQDELAAARADGARMVYARWRRVLRGVTGSGFVQKAFAAAVTSLLLAIGIGVWR